MSSLSLVPVVLILISIFNLENSYAEPFTRRGGVKVRNKDVVIGSAHVSSHGQQPHYRIDLESPEYQSVRRSLNNELRSKPNLSRLERIDFITQFVNKQFINTNYRDPKLNSINNKYIKQSKPVPLSCVIKFKTGVCREHNLLLHLLLKEQGVNTRYVTGIVASGVATENHTFLVLNEKGKPRITLDAYFDKYHGQNYDKLVKSNLTKSAKLKQNKVDLNGSTKSSVFERVRSKAEERITILGERNYALREPSSKVLTKNGRIKNQKLQYKNRHATRKVSTGCTSRDLLDALLKAAK